MVHPGALHTQADFDRMTVKVAARLSPWIDDWNVLIANGHASLAYVPNPQPIVYRGDDGVDAQNYGILYNDAAAAYQCALRWRVSHDAAYADKAVQIMNAWASTLTALGGNSNVALLAGLQGYQLANAGEMMRGYAGWATADFAAFQSMMRSVFYTLNHSFLSRSQTKISHYWCNWDACNMASAMAIGILCDDRSIFDEVVTFFKSGGGNGAIAQAVYYLHPGHLGQWQESGRDQAHNTLGLSLIAMVCEMAWNQGVDLYGYDNNRFLAGAEYVAKANLIESGTTYYTVPYVTYNNCDSVNQTVMSPPGSVRVGWAMICNHYVNRKGLALPYGKKALAVMGIEGGGGNYGPNSGGYDSLGFGTLTCTLDPIASGAPPSGLSAVVNGSQMVVLSWWGSAYASDYAVKRAAAAGGPFTMIASGITDFLSYADTPPAAGTWYYLVTATMPGGGTAASNVVSAITGIVLHTSLAFDEGAGSTAADASGNGHVATLQAGAAWGTGRSGGALSLDGKGGYASLAADALDDVSDFTIATWVYLNGANTWARVFDFGSSTSRYMMLTPRTNAGVACFAITVAEGAAEQRITSTAALPTGRWVHVAVTLTGQTGTLYIDGAAIGTNTAMAFAPFRLRPTQNWIGRSQFAADATLNGLVDDFRIYRGALTATQVAALAR